MPEVYGVAELFFLDCRLFITSCIYRIYVDEFMSSSGIINLSSDISSAVICVNVPPGNLLK